MDYPELVGEQTICLFCRREVTPSHVVVRKQGRLVGAICGSHSFREVILHTSNSEGERLIVEISLVKDI